MLDIQRALGVVTPSDTELRAARSGTTAICRAQYLRTLGAAIATVFAATIPAAVPAQSASPAWEYVGQSQETFFDIDRASMQRSGANVTIWGRERKEGNPLANLLGGGRDRLSHHLIRCADRVAVLLEQRDADKSGRVVSQTVLHRVTDPTLPFVTITPGSIYAGIAQKVCPIDSPSLNVQASPLIGKPLNQIAWADIGYTDGRAYVFRIDKESIKVAGNLREVIGLEEHKPERMSPSGMPARFLVTRTLIDCATRKYKAYEADFYSATFEALDRTRSQRELVDWATANPGSIAESTWKVVCAGDSTAADQAQAIKPQPTPSTTSSESTKPQSATGSGWVTHTGYLVTAFHVVAGSSRISVIDNKKQIYPAKIATVDAANDVAVLSVDFRGPIPRGIAFAASPQPIGSRVFTIGFPLVSTLGFSQKLTAGEISAMSGLQDDPRFFQISAPVQSGNSGGPLLSARGDVVGLISSKLRADAVLKATGDLPQNVNYAVKGRYVEGLIAELPPIVGAGRIAPVTGDMPLDQVAARVQDAVFLIYAEQETK